MNGDQLSEGSDIEIVAPPAHYFYFETQNREIACFICTESTCEDKGLICYCCLQLHPKHKMITLKKILEIYENSNKASVIGSASFVLGQQLQRIKEKSMNEIAQSASAIAETYNRLRNGVEKYFNELIEMIQTITNTPQRMRTLNKQDIIDREQETKEVVKRLVTELNRFENPSGEMPKSRTDDIFIAGEFKYRDILKSNRNLFQAYRTEAEKFEEKLHFNMSELKQFRLSHTSKGPNIEFVSPFTVKNNSKSHQCCLIDQPLSHHVKRNWAFKVDVNPIFVSIGIANEAIARRTNFVNILQKSNEHGCYGIRTDGQVFKNGTEFAAGSFTFAAGDTIYVEYDPMARLLRFAKGADLEPRYQIEIQGDPQIVYQPFVDLASATAQATFLPTGVSIP